MRFGFSKWLTCLCAASVCGFGSLALAATIEPSDLTGSAGTDPWGNSPNTVLTTRSTIPWDRPTTLSQASTDLTTFQAWDLFTVSGIGNNNAPNSNLILVGPNTANVDSAPFNPNGIASVQETTLTSIVTGGGSGNIYNPGGPAQISIAIPNYNQTGLATNFLVQVRTQGTIADISSFMINGQPLAGLPNFNYQEIYNLALGGFGGNLIDYKFEFTLPSNNALDTITFAATGPHQSLDKVFVDTQAVSMSAVPEPGTWAIMISGGLIFLSVARNRHRAIVVS